MESDWREIIIPMHGAKRNPRCESEKDNNDGDLGMSKNQAGMKIAHAPCIELRCSRARHKTKVY
jgi:hypothetical protein